MSSRATQFLLLPLLWVCCDCLSFSFKEVQKIECPFSDNIRSFLHDDKLQRKITVNWVRTHQVEAWKSSRSTLVTNKNAYPEIDKYEIPMKLRNRNKLFYVQTTYKSAVKLPKILKTIMKTTIKTNTIRKSFVIGNREYKLIKITGVPLIHHISIFSRSVYMKDGSVYTSHNVETGEIPFWALWSQHLVQGIIRDSASDFQKQVTIDLCRYK